MTNIVNYCKNPSFEVNATDDWTVSGGGPVAADAAQYKVGAKSCRFTATAAETYIYCTAGVSVANGAPVTVQCWVRCSATPVANKLKFMIYDTTTPAVRMSLSATAAANGAWEYLTGSWTNATGGAKTCVLLIDNLFADSATETWIDGCQLQLTTAATAYTDGAQGEGHSWAGDAHNSVSTWTEPAARPSASISPYMLV